MTDFDSVPAGKINKFDAGFVCGGSVSQAIEGFFAGAIAFVRADGVGFDHSNYNVRADGAKLGGENADPARVSGYARLPRADIAKVRFDDDLARKSCRKQPGNLLQRGAETGCDLRVVFDADGRNFSVQRCWSASCVHGAIRGGWWVRAAGECRSRKRRLIFMRTVVKAGRSTRRMG